MRTRYRWDPDEEKLVPISDSRGEYGVLICPDLEPFKSPIDGSVITGRAALRRHDKRHNVTNVADFTGTWEKARAEREKFYRGDKSFDRTNRIEAIKRALEARRT